MTSPLMGDPEIRRLLLDLRWWDLPIDNIKSIVLELSNKPDIDSVQRLLERFKKNQ